MAAVLSGTPWDQRVKGLLATRPVGNWQKGSGCAPNIDSRRTFGCTFSPVTMGHIRKDHDGVHLDYSVTERQDFDQAVFGLLQLVQQAQREHPDEPRHLHLAIEGHRLPNGDFDLDALELQSKFLIPDGALDQRDHTFLRGEESQAPEQRCSAPEHIPA